MQKKLELQSAIFKFEDATVEWTPLKENEKDEPWQKWRIRVFLRETISTSVWKIGAVPSATTAKTWIGQASKLNQIVK